ncbi:MAG: transporter substrate-binding domain-containing protein, partial [Rhodospirillales bacterium]|nr:transporter substrate-binding domain-containing protein [Rhodospirillales bacterium]
MSKFLPRISKIIFAPIIGGLLVAGSLPVWGSGPEETKPTSIIAGVVSNFPPYYQTDKSGNPTGFAIDVLNGVAKHVGLAVTYRSFKAPRDMRAALRAGHVHVVPSLSVSKARKKDFLFTQTVSTIRVSLFVRNKTYGITSLSDLTGKLIGALEHKRPARLLAAMGHTQIKIYKNVPSALFGLLSGQVEAFVFPEAVFWKFAHKSRVAEQIRALETPIAEVKRAMLVAKGNVALQAQLNRGLEKFLASNEFTEIYRNWFGTPTPFWTVKRLFFVFFGLLILTIILLAGWRHSSVLRLNRALQKSDERYAFAISGSQSGLWEWNILTGEQYFSLRWLEILGYADGELKNVHQTFEELLHPDDKSRAIEGVKAHLEGHIPFDIEYRLRRKDGDYTWVNAKGQAIWDEEGKPIRMAGSTNDITDRKIAELDLRMARDELETKITERTHHLELEISE